MNDAYQNLYGAEVNAPKSINAQPDQDGKWVIFPDSLPTQKFIGFQDRDNETILKGAFVLGQNVMFGGDSLPTLRQGFEVIGTEATNATPVQRAWIFETPSGDVFELKAYDTGLYYWLVGVSTEYALLKGGFTAAQEFGFGNIGQIGVDFYTWFCNGVEPWYQFNGANTTIASVTSNTITKNGTDAWEDTGFYNSGTRSIIIKGVEYSYTGGDSSTTLTGVSPDPTGIVLANDLAVQSPRQPSFYVTLPFKAASTGAFDVGEIVTGGSSSATGIVRTVDPYGLFIVVQPTSGTFQGGETVTGGTSSATGVLLDYFDQTVGPPISNIIMAHDGRLHTTDGSLWDYSHLNDPSDWTTGNLDGDGGSKDIEFSGSLVSFGKLNKSILAYKNRLIKILQFTQNASRVDVPFYQTLIPADDKGTTLGAINQRSTFSTPKGLVFITPDKRMVLLTGITANDEPEYMFLSDPIQPIFVRGVHDDASGICVDNVIYYSFKQDENSTYNDVVLRGDMTRQSYDKNGVLIPIQWDVPTVGWNVKDWTAIFNQGTGETVIHWHSSTNSNSYAVSVNKTDNNQSFTAIIRSWFETFDYPQFQKTMDYAYLEIEMNPNTQGLVTFLYDENGFTQTQEYTISGDDAANRFDRTDYNPFGANPFGYEKFGSNGLNESMGVYRYIFEVDPNVYFFNLAMQFGVENENNDFRIVRFGFHIKEVKQTPQISLLKGS